MAGADEHNTAALTRLLDAARVGDEAAERRLFPLVYDELRRLAARSLRQERPDHTLQPTALVHEVWLNLAGSSEVDWASRGHFFGVAAKAMRHILVNHAKRRKRLKRGGDARRVQLHPDLAGDDGPDVDLVALDEVLERLAELDRQKARVVELRYFAGLSVEETARALDVSPRTVRREWTFAKSWLRGELTLGGSASR